VRDPFEPTARFDDAGFAARWPRSGGAHARQRARRHGVAAAAAARGGARKRRIGLGFTGLGDALVMLGLRYDTEPARAMASRIAELMRDAAYAASVELAASAAPSRCSTPTCT
jgi:ribonucleoside-diphosphate reductase alpha chain